METVAIFVSGAHLNGPLNMKQLPKFTVQYIFFFSHNGSANTLSLKLKCVIAHLQMGVALYVLSTNRNLSCGLSFHFGHWLTRSFDP